jgi:hypothetical protein
MHFLLQNCKNVPNRIPSRRSSQSWLLRPMIPSGIRQFCEPLATIWHTKQCPSPIFARLPRKPTFWIKKQRSCAFPSPANSPQLTTHQRLASSDSRNTQNPKFKNRRAPYTYGFRHSKTPSKTVNSRSFLDLRPPTSRPFLLRLFSLTQVPIIKRFTAVRSSEPRPIQPRLVRTLTPDL